MDFKKAYDSVRREVLYNIFIEFGIPKKLLRLIKILRWIFRKWEGVMGTGWSWLRIGTGGGHL